MTSFYQNARASTFAGQNTKPAVLAQMPWARQRSAQMEISTNCAPVATGAALNTVVGTASVKGSYVAPVTWSMNNSDGGNFSIDAAGVIKTAKTPPITPLGLHTIFIVATDAQSNAQIQGVTITVV